MREENAAASIPDAAVHTETAQKAVSREKIIIRTSLVGIAANVLLAAFKLAVGLLTGSIAVTMDAVNNFTDALSSFVTIIGTKLAGRRADRKHPMGHGRIEYLTALIIAAIIIYAGITALVESIKKIIAPETANYTALSLIIISVAVAVKIVVGLYVLRKGREAGSDALKGSGKDALFDAALSASVLASALVYIWWKVPLESYVGALIALFIIKAGVEMLAGTLNKILGERPDAALTQKIKELIRSVPGVRGAYDLVMNSYGPETTLASVNIEVREDMQAAEIDEISRRVQALVIGETGVILTTVGIYSYNIGEEEDGSIYKSIRETVMRHDWALELHGLYVDNVNMLIRFDVVISFDVDPDEALATLYGEMQALCPEYRFYIVADADLSD